MEGSLFKRGVLENYKPIAKSFGITIPALKKILQEEKLLVDSHPSDEAVEKGIAIIETVTNERYGTNERILWSVPVIGEILEKRNVKLLNGDEAYLFVENFSQLTDRIALLGERLMAALELGYEEKAPAWMIKKFGEKSGELARQAADDLADAIFENIHYLMVSDKNEFDKMLRGNFENAFKIAESSSAEIKDEIKFCRRLYEFIFEWSTQKRITQHQRQPRN